MKTILLLLLPVCLFSQYEKLDCKTYAADFPDDYSFMYNQCQEYNTIVDEYNAYIANIRDLYKDDSKTLKLFEKDQSLWLEQGKSLFEYHYAATGTARKYGHLNFFKIRMQNRVDELNAYSLK